MTNRESLKIAALILAAGQGKRMRSNTPKVLHPLLGKAMIWYAIEAAQEATGEKPILVIGQAAEQVRQEVGDAANFVLQASQQGTAHAVMQTESLLRGNTDYLLVITADMPLLTSTTLEQSLAAHLTSGDQNQPPPPITMLSVNSPQSRGFGRLVRGQDGRVAAIIEEAQASEQQLEIHEFNASVYCFTTDWLWGALPRISVSPAGEYYLTDLVQIAVADGLNVQALSLEDPNEAIGINTRIHLAEAEAILRQRINQELMLGGVSIIDPQTTYIEASVKIGMDTIIWPNTYLHGSTRIGENCTIGPNSSIRDTSIGDGCKVIFSFTESAILEDDVDIGPFARLRKGAHLAQGVHMGNFGEVKNSYLGPGTKMGHFSYIGDANIGPGVNIGAGVITANYDGQRKYPTEIGAGAFIGSDTMLVAPLKIGEGASTAAGAVVTKDVPPNTLAVGMPARAIRKKEDDDGP